MARIGDTWRNQVEETGHGRRLADLDAVAELGIRKLRYPVLWEMVAPERPDVSHWAWLDERLRHLRKLGIDVVAGLLHHGSGPRYTSLIDPDFPRLLAGHATEVAQRYPWITAFTPVNEPLTTARFSGLYGHWFPHGRHESTLLRVLFIQCQAIAAAMAAIRRVTPDARLVQTEDLGRIFGTEALAYQVKYENHRRWLSFDLLTGRVGRHHPFFTRFVAAGVAEGELLALADMPCPPDVIGINHYLTSDRYLDHDVARYPAEAVGGNAWQQYADVAAVRARVPAEQIGFAARLREAWDRYGLPVAATEVHNGSTRDEQLRWLLETWQGVQQLRAGGVDVRAFCVWALAGAVDWSSLLTQRRGHYEPGLLDARNDPPRATALARAVRSIASGQPFEHPVLGKAGWWRRADRFHIAADATGEVELQAPAVHAGLASRTLLVTGRTGTLGRAFSRIADRRGLTHLLVGRQELDISDQCSAREVLQRVRPWALVNAAGFVRVAQAAREPQRCMRENAEGPAVLASLAAELGIPFMTFSSDLVFDGLAGRPYVESDRTSPGCVYGKSKALAERNVLARHDGAMVIRTAAFFGPWDRYNFAHAVVERLSRGETFEADADAEVSPTYVPDLVDAALDLLIDGAAGLWHVANDGHSSWYTFARSIASARGLDPDLVQAAAGSGRRTTALASERGVRLPALEDAITRFVGDSSPGI